MELGVGTGDDVVVRTAEVGRVVAAVVGVLDRVSADRIADRAVGLLKPGEGVLVLDLSGVTFCDSSGLSAMLLVWRRAREIGARLAFVEMPSQLSRRFQVTGLQEVLGCYPTAGDALAAHDPAR